MWRALVLVVLLAAATLAGWWWRAPAPPPPRSTLVGIAEIRTVVTPRLTAALAAKGLGLGKPLHIRIFKETSELEAWIEAPDGRYRLFKTFPICAYSGGLGPKLKEGDRQSPEGVYEVGRGQLNPNSSYHLSFDLGFPNALDRAHARTGSFLMVHGDCRSVGCYAMTDPGIEEIYLLVEAAQRGGAKVVPVHAFPFRMTEGRLEREQASPWYPFWRDLKVIHDRFEADRRPPRVGVVAGRYVLAAVD